jgi:hypothetical protein
MGGIRLLGDSLSADIGLVAPLGTGAIMVDEAFGKVGFTTLVGLKDFQSDHGSGR